MGQMAIQIRQRLNQLVPVVNAHMAAKTAAGVVVPGQAEHDDLIRQYTAALWTWGEQHGWQETQHAGQHQFAAGPPKPPGPVPQNAVDYANSRVVLQGNWQRSLDDQVTKAIALGIQQGATTKEVMAALERIFPTFSKSRLENIARTESVMAYNQGRLQAFRSNAFVAAVQFVAILDNRTTDICRERDGLIMRIDDPRLDANTPPLHYQCRSTLAPVDKYSLNLLEQGKASTEQRFFGWVKEGGPKSLAEAEARWKDVPKPLPGFGAVEDLGKTPAPVEAVKPSGLGDKVKDAITKGGTIAEKDVTHADLARGGKILANEIQARLDWDAKTKTARDLAESTQKTREHLEKARDATAHPASRDIINKAFNEASKAAWKAQDALQALTKSLEAEWSSTVKDVVSEIKDLGLKDSFVFGSGTDPKAEGYLNKAFDFIPSSWGSDMADWTKSRSIDVAVRFGPAYSPATNTLFTDGKIDATLHEAGHWIETYGQTNAGRLALVDKYANEFRDFRFGGHKPESLGKLLGDPSYDPYMAIKDNFSHPYVGRIYNNKGTEVTAMGLEALFFRRYEMWEKDPDMIHFTLGMLSWI